MAHEQRLLILEPVKAPRALCLVALWMATGVMADTQYDLGLKYLSHQLRNPGTAGWGGIALTIDEQGSFYSTGEIHDTSRFGSTIVECSGISNAPFECRDLFVAKYDRQRKLVWLDHAPNSGGTAIAAYGTNWVIVAGKIWGDTRIAGREVRHAGKGRSAFLARYDASGKAEWIRTFDGPVASEIHGVALATNGDVLATGEMNGPLDFGGTTLKPRGRTDGFLARYTRDGNLLWVRQHGDSNAQPGGVAMDVHGNGYVVGRCWGSFGGVKLRPGSGMYLIKYDPTGNVLWSTNADTDVEVTRRRAPEGIEGRTVIVDHEGNPYVVGLTGGTRVFGSITISNESKYLANVFLAKYEANGVLQWVRQLREGDGRFEGAVSLASATALPTGNSADRKINGQGKLDAMRWSREAAAVAAIDKSAPAPAVLEDAKAASARSLRIFKAGDSVVLVWPASSKQFRVEAAESLMPFPIWTSISAPQSMEGNFVTVTLPARGAAKFYRLRAP